MNTKWLFCCAGRTLNRLKLIFRKHKKLPHKSQWLFHLGQHFSVNCFFKPLSQNSGHLPCLLLSGSKKTRNNWGNPVFKIRVQISASTFKVEPTHFLKKKRKKKHRNCLIIQKHVDKDYTNITSGCSCHAKSIIWWLSLRRIKSCKNPLMMGRKMKLHLCMPLLMVKHKATISSDKQNKFDNYCFLNSTLINF